jgi:hypothetical protein
LQEAVASLLAKGFRNESTAKLGAFYCNTDRRVQRS